MSKLKEFLLDEINFHAEEYGEQLTWEQAEEIAGGLEFNIDNYLAEQIPEQMEVIRGLTE